MSVTGDTSTVILLAAGGVGERAGVRLGDVYSALDHKPGTAGSIIAELRANKKSPHVLTVLRAGVAVDITVPPFQD